MGSGGGSSETTTVDPVYNAGMLALSQEQQGWAREMFNMFKYGVTYDPNEKVTSDQKVWVPEQRGGKVPIYDRDGNIKGYQYDSLTPGHYETVTVQGTDIRGEVEGYDPDSVTSEMEYLQNLVESNQSLLGLQTDAQKKRLELYGTYIGDINKGIDVNARMDEAQAGVQHGFKNANKAARMDISSYGLDPSSGRYKSQNRESAMTEATAVAGARTDAKNYAELEDFQRKTVGLQIG